MSQKDKILEGPFTYDIDQELSRRYEDDEIAVSTKDQPVIALMYALMKIYNCTVKCDYDEAQRKILELEELWKNLDMKHITSEKISTVVLKHIKDSTLYYFNFISGNEKKSDEIFEQIVDSREYTSNIELATLYGCRAIGWSSFHEAGHQQAINHAKRASAYCRDCPLWHFVLYKNYRISRCKLGIHTKPLCEETSSILECTNYAENPFYCLHAAQMYRESKNYKMALAIYRKVYDAKPESCGILLRLALGMLRCKKKNIPKELLDQVEEKYPNDPMFLHYKGLFLEAGNNYEAALKYYERSAKYNNYVADMQYVKCRLKFDKNFECVQHLQMLMDKYTDEEHTQQLLLHLAMNYLNYLNFIEACNCFVQAIQINRNSNQLKMFNNDTVDNKNINIFNFIKNELIPQCDSVDPIVMQRLLNLCK